MNLNMGPEASMSGASAPSNPTEAATQEAMPVSQDLLETQTALPTVTAQTTENSSPSMELPTVNVEELRNQAGKKSFSIRGSDGVQRNFEIELNLLEQSMMDNGIRSIKALLEKEFLTPIKQAEAQHGVSTSSQAAGIARGNKEFVEEKMIPILIYYSYKVQAYIQNFKQNGIQVNGNEFLKEVTQTVDGLLEYVNDRSRLGYDNFGNLAKHLEFLKASTI